jgi:GNAT superfamily N-acetyltransferase
MSDAVVRLARVEDAEVLSALGRSTFIDTFVVGFGVPYPEADLTPYLDKSFNVATTRSRLADPIEAWWVAERDGAILGFANAGPNTLPHPDGRPSHAELRRLYVTKSAQGTGLGTRLLDVALAWMAAHTEGPLWIGVWSGNLKAQKLYGAYGFEKVGEYKYPVGTWFDDELILRRG